MATQTQEIRNMRLISHDLLNGFGNIGEGVHLYQDRSGRRVLYMAHESAPKDITGVDVTDIANPKVIVQTDLDYPHLRSNSLSIVGDTMLVAYQSQQPGPARDGDGRLRRQQRRGTPAHRLPRHEWPLLPRLPCPLVGRRPLRPPLHRRRPTSSRATRRTTSCT